MDADLTIRVNNTAAAMRNYSDTQDMSEEQVGGLAAGTGLKGLASSDATECKGIVQELIKLVRAGVWVPVEIVIARPFIEHLMLSAIVTVSGRDTGATLFGPADMQISANTSVKTIEGYACFLEATHSHGHTYTFQYRGTGSLPQTRPASATVGARLWILKNSVGRRSVSLRGILPKGWRCKAVFSAEGPKTARLMHMRPSLKTLPFSTCKSRSNIVSIAVAGIRHSSRRRFCSSTTEKQYKSASPVA